jgi:hypothetical protein
MVLDYSHEDRSNIKYAVAARFVFYRVTALAFLWNTTIQVLVYVASNQLVLIP